MTTKLMLELKDGVEPALNRLLEVNGRRRIETVLIKQEADENDSGWSEEEWDKKPPGRPKQIANADFHRLFHSIGQMEILREFVLDYYLFPIPIKALGELVLPADSSGPSRIATIATLRLRHLNLSGDVNEFRAFSDSLLRMPTLVTVCITSCKAQYLGSSDCLINALTSISTLKELTLEEMDISGEPLASVCRLPSLCSLKLRHIPASNQYMSLMAKAMSTSQALQRLQIRYALDQNAALSFFELLEGNSSLEAVDIDMDCWDNYGMHLAQALKTNARLSDLDINIFGKDQHVEGNAAALADALAENTALKRLCMTFHSRLQQDDAQQLLHMERLSKAFVAPFENIMPKNVALGELLVGPVHERVYFGTRAQFYLKLNQAGRQKLLESHEASPKEWVETFIRYRDDLDVLYYFLSLNPSLTDRPSLSSSITDDESISTVTKDLIVEPRYKKLKWEDASRQTMG